MKTREKLNFFVLAVLLVLLSSEIARAGGGNWQDVLNLLNNKRVDVGKDPVNVSHPEDIDMDGVLAIQAGTIDILEDYGFTGLADALNCVGYEHTTWSEGFDCKYEIYDILNLMKIGHCTYKELVISSSIIKTTIREHIRWAWAWTDETYTTNLGFILLKGLPDYRENLCHLHAERNGQYCYYNHHQQFTLKSVEAYVIEKGYNFGKVVKEEDLISYYPEISIWVAHQIEPYGIYGVHIVEKWVTRLGSNWWESKFPGVNGGSVYISLPSNSAAKETYYGNPFENYNVRFTYAYHTCKEKLPRASFTYSPENPFVTQEITFDASSSSDSDGQIVSYEWNFGDGNSDEGMQATHNYANLGNYTVTLTVTDNDGLHDSLSKIVTIIEDSEPPTASFTYSPEKPMVGGKIDFDASNSKGNIVKYKWDFDDGQLGSGPEVYHIFRMPKIYDVNLTVTDENGLTDSNSVELDLSLKNGDLLLWKAEGSWVPGFWTHVGIYRELSNAVIEARYKAFGIKWDRVGLFPLSDWFHPNITCAEVLRVNTDQPTRDAAVDFAWWQLNEPYDLLSICYDRKQHHDDPDPWLEHLHERWYCSELVWDAYYFASGGNINLDADHEGAVAPDDINSSGHVEFRGEHIEDIPEPAWFLWLISLSPVDLELSDPDGLVLNKGASEIPGAVYEETDVDGDGDLDDLLAIPEPKEGDYLIHVIPEPDASPTDTYSLKVTANGVVFTLAEEVQVNNIPAQPYIVRLTGTEITPVIPVAIDFDPDTLNLRSKGKLITVYIEIPVGHGYDVGDIGVDRILLEGLLEVQHRDVQDGVLMVKFDRQDVIIFLESVLGVIPPDEVTLTVTGELTYGTLFEGSDTIRVIESGKK